jgi:hypothetical protein
LKSWSRHPEVPEREAVKGAPSPDRIDVRPLAPIATPTGRAADMAAVMASREYTSPLSK